MSVRLELREWQAAFAERLAAHPRPDFLLVACPAAGKTIGAAAAIAGVMPARGCDQLVVVCPTVVVRDQWAAQLDRLGFRMLTNVSQTGWPGHAHGVCATYAQVAQRAGLYAEACAGRATAVVFDEVHHAGQQLAWGEAIADGFAGARLRLALSGTPFRSDGARIPFVPYGPGGKCVPDFTYDYMRAVSDGVCRPVEFRAHDGLITWLEDGEPRTASYAQRLDGVARARRLRASLDPTQPYLQALLADAHQDLLDMRAQVPDAAGLVVCDTQAHAVAVDRLLTEITGRIPVLAISDIPRAHQAIAQFARMNIEWLVSVRMVAEGVDIPRLGVIAWATAGRTELMVRQVAGRALRGRADHARLPAIVHMPADPELVRYAERMHVLGGVTLEHHDPGTAGAGVPGGGSSGRALSQARALRAIDAQPSRDLPQTVTPPAPCPRVHAAPCPVDVFAPQLPPSPEDLAAAVEAHEAARAELYRLLGTYAQLRRATDPAYHLAAAHAELVDATGVTPRADVPLAELEAALGWLRRRGGRRGGREPRAAQAARPDPPPTGGRGMSLTVLLDACAASMWAFAAGLLLAAGIVRPSAWLVVAAAGAVCLCGVSWWMLSRGLRRRTGPAASES